MPVDPGFEELYRTEVRTVFRGVYLYCRDREVAEDATQEAFARALERWDRLHGHSWVVGWVITTSLNVARRALRRRRLVHPLSGEGGDPEESIDIWASLRSLSSRQQEALVLRYRLDLPVHEIAQIMRCSEGTVRTHLFRGRENLRAELEGAVGWRLRTTFAHSFGERPTLFRCSSPVSIRLCGGQGPAACGST